MRFNVFLLFVVLFCSITYLPSTVHSANHIKKYRSATVPIVAFEPPQNTNGSHSRKFVIYGTGFIFQWNRRVITCASVLDAIPSKHFLPTSYVGVLVKPKGSKKSLSEEREFHAIKVTAIDRKMDLALLETDGDLPIKPLSRSGEAIDIGEVVSTTSFHKSQLVPTFYESKVSALVKANGMAAPYYALLSPVGQGAHGSPVFSPTNGNLVGILRVHTRLLSRTVHSLPGFESEGLATALVIPTANLLELLNKVPKQD